MLLDAAGEGRVEGVAAGMAGAEAGAEAREGIKAGVQAAEQGPALQKPDAAHMTFMLGACAAC